MAGFFEMLATKGRMHRIYMFAEYQGEGGYGSRSREFFRAFVKDGEGILLAAALPTRIFWTLTIWAAWLRRAALRDGEPAGWRREKIRPLPDG